MKKHAILILLITLCSSLFGQQEAELKFNETIVELSVEKQSRFSTISGSADGPEMIQKMGTLKEVIGMIDKQVLIEVSPKYDRYLWKLTAKGPDARNLSRHLHTIIDKFAELNVFEWNSEKREVEVLKAELERVEKLEKYLNKENGTITSYSITIREMSFIDTPGNIVKKIHENRFSSLPLVIAKNLEMDKTFKVKVDRHSESEIFETLLSKYGIALSKVIETRDFISIK